MGNLEISDVLALEFQFAGLPAPGVGGSAFALPTVLETDLSLRLHPMGNHRRKAGRLVRVLCSASVQNTDAVAPCG